MKKTKIGICKICKEKKELSFEHIPPRSAFNKETKYYSLSSEDYYKNAKEYIFDGRKPRTKKEQGGHGDYCLCEKCNGFLGSKYVRDYKKFAQIAMNIMLSEKEEAKAYKFDISDINLLNFLKQITAIFICSNDISFTKSYPELLEFVKDEKMEFLPKNFRFYMYLNIEGQIRNGNRHFTNYYGEICEFTFRPFGFILNINNPDRIMEVSEITGFQFYNRFDKTKEVPIVLNKYPTWYPIPVLDFRTKEELNGST